MGSCASKDSTSNLDDSTRDEVVVYATESSPVAPHKPNQRSSKKSNSPGSAIRPFAAGAGLKQFSSLHGVATAHQRAPPPEEIGDVSLDVLDSFANDEGAGSLSASNPLLDAPDRPMDTLDLSDDSLHRPASSAASVGSPPPLSRTVTPRPTE